VIKKIERPTFFGVVFFGSFLFDMDVLKDFCGVFKTHLTEKRPKTRQNKTNKQIEEKVTNDFLSVFV
jgi:hypothetical protein